MNTFEFESNRRRANYSFSRRRSSMLLRTPVSALVVGFVVGLVMLFRRDNEPEPKTPTLAVSQSSPNPPPFSQSDPGSAQPIPEPSGLIEAYDEIDKGSMMAEGAKQDPTADPTAGSTCEEQYNCTSDRLAQNVPMRVGQAICSRGGQFMFGMDNGSLIWKDCFTGETKNYFRNGSKDDYFVIDEFAKFTVHSNGGKVNWERSCNAEVTRTEMCLSKPALDCPYLHIHKKRGIVVLNYIDNWGNWISKNANKMYEF